MIALAITMIFGFGVVASADGPGRAEQAGPVSPTQVKGEVSKIDGDRYAVRDQRTGKDVEFAIEKDLRATFERPLKVGDQIEAQLTPEGYAKAVTLVAKQDQQNRSQGRDMENKGTKDKTGPKDLGTIQGQGAGEPK
jgi:hypothetical protein